MMRQTCGYSLHKLQGRSAFPSVCERAKGSFAPPGPPAAQERHTGFAGAVLLGKEGEPCRR